MKVDLGAKQAILLKAFQDDHFVNLTAEQKASLPNLNTILNTLKDACAVFKLACDQFIADVQNVT